MSNEKEIREATHYIQQHIDFSPQVGIILGTGLGALVDDITISHILPYEEIPHFPLSTVESHKGN